MELIPDYKEIYRYLGYRGQTPTEESQQAINEVVEALSKVIRPAEVHQCFDVEILSEDSLKIGGNIIHSKDLCRNMDGCKKAYMLAATIGLDVDKLIKRYERTDMFKAAVCQAAGAAFVETWVDHVNDQIKAEALSSGYLCKPRFSPGYGDLPLELQKVFEQELGMRRNCGITLTDTLLMVPSKSVTAYVGLYEDDGKECVTHKNHSLEDCLKCNIAGSCAYSKIESEN